MLAPLFADGQNGKKEISQAQQNLIWEAAQNLIEQDLQSLMSDLANPENTEEDKQDKISIYSADKKYEPHGGIEVDYDQWNKKTTRVDMEDFFLSVSNNYVPNLPMNLKLTAVKPLDSIRLSKNGKYTVFVTYEERFDGKNKNGVKAQPFYRSANVEVDYSGGRPSAKLSFILFGSSFDELKQKGGLAQTVRISKDKGGANAQTDVLSNYTDSAAKADYQRGRYEYEKRNNLVEAWVLYNEAARSDRYRADATAMYNKISGEMIGKNITDEKKITALEERYRSLQGQYRYDAATRYLYYLSKLAGGNERAAAKYADAALESGREAAAEAERQSYLNRGKEYLQTAIDKYQEAQKQKPGNPFNLIGLGRAYFAAGEETKANISFEQAKILDPNNAYTYFWQANLYKDSKSYEKAIATYITYKDKLEDKSQYAADQVESEISFCRGMQHFEKREFIEAEQDFKKALQQNPANADALQYLLYINKQNSNLKMAVIEQALALEPSFAFAWLQKAKELVTKDPAASQLAVRRALLLDNNLSDAHAVLGDLMMRNGRNTERSMLDSAIFHYNASIAQGASNPTIFCHRAQAFLLRNGNDDNLNADKDLQVAGKYTSGASYVITKGDLLLRKREYRDALEWYSKAGDDDYAHLGKALAYFLLHDDKNAEEAADKISSRARKTPIAYYNIAPGLWDTSDFKKQFKKYLEF